MAERSKQRSSQKRSSHRRGPQEVLTYVERGMLPTKERRTGENVGLSRGREGASERGCQG